MWSIGPSSTPQRHLIHPLVHRQGPLGLPPGRGPSACRTFLQKTRARCRPASSAGTGSSVPGFGTGELTGLRGEGGFRANLGEGAQVHLDSWFE